MATLAATLQDIPKETQADELAGEHGHRTCTARRPRDRMKPSLFISHRSLDNSFARALSELVSAAGLTNYLDANDAALQGTPTRTDVSGAIERALGAATHLVAIISPFSRNSSWVPYEIGVARARGCQIVAVVQAGVREPEYLEDARVLRSRAALVAWIGSLTPISAAIDSLLERIDSWFAMGDQARAPMYRQAIDHLESLWAPETWVALRLDDERYAFAGRWMGCASDYLIHILYSMIAPIALYPRTAGLSELERAIVEAVYRSFADDEVLARADPGQPYEARRCTDWRTQRMADPRKYWLQGLLPRDLDAARAELRDEREQLVSREAFASKYLALYRGSDRSAQKPLGLAANGLQGFELRTRPIFARLAAAQVRLYNALLRLDQFGEVRSPRSGLFALEPSSAIVGTEESNVSRQYVVQRVVPDVARAIGAASREFLDEGRLR